MKRVSLRADIVAVLSENDNRWMAPDIVAMCVNGRRLFRKPSGKSVTGGEVSSCVSGRHCRERFERKGSFIRLAGRETYRGVKMEL